MSDEEKKEIMDLIEGLQRQINELREMDEEPDSPVKSQILEQDGEAGDPADPNRKVTFKRGSQLDSLEDALN